MPQIVGTIRRIDELKTPSDTFKSQDLILNTEEQYSQVLAISFVQDKVALLANFNAGDKVKIEINLRGKEVKKEGKPLMVFNSLNGWKIEKVV